MARRKKSRLEERIEKYKSFDPENTGTDELVAMLEADLQDQGAVVEDVELNRREARRRLGAEDA